MATRTPRLAPVHRIDDLCVTCWCEASIVHVTPAALKAGQTATCGRRGCQPDDGAA